MTTRGITPVRANEGRYQAVAQTSLSLGQTRFGNSLATRLYNALPPPVNFRVGNISLEDLTARLMVWTIYLPQGIMAIRYRQNPFETWSRNILVWMGTIGATLLAKHPKYGFNAIFNEFMVPQARLKKLPDSLTGKIDFMRKHPRYLLDALVNPFRPKENYLQFLKEAGVNLKSFGYKGEDLSVAIRKYRPWTSLDINEKMLLLQLKKGAKSAAKARAIENIVKRMTLCKFVSVGMSSMLIAYVIGVALQKAIFTFVAPLDKRFTPRVKLPSGGDAAPQAGYNGRFSALNMPPQSALQLGGMVQR